MANESFVIFLTFGLVTCFIDNFTSIMTSQSIAYILNESEHIYWILDLGDEVHSLWVIWTSRLQECKGNFIFRSQVERTTSFGQDEKFRIVLWDLAGGTGWRAPAPIHLPLIVRRGRYIIHH